MQQHIFDINACYDRILSRIKHVPGKSENTAIICQQYLEWHFELLQDLISDLDKLGCLNSNADLIVSETIRIKKNNNKFYEFHRDFDAQLL
jgi:hypothetical protein